MINIETHLSDSEIEELYQAAKLAREKSYSPYSQCKVGAAIRTQTGHIYSGCNIENASFGATICAERVAIQKAISENGKLDINAIMVVTKNSPPWPPCGMCRQVIAEFGPHSIIYMANLDGELKSIPFKELFPQAFDPSSF